MNDSLKADGSPAGFDVSVYGSTVRNPGDMGAGSQTLEITGYPNDYQYVVVSDLVNGVGSFGMSYHTVVYP